MKQQHIPQSELQPSVICLGAVLLGSKLDKAESFAMLDTFMEKGGDFVDTANVYSDWLPGGKSTSERMIGKWLGARGNRNKVVLATKGAHPDLATMHVSRVTPADIVHDIAQSLGHLNTDYIDQYWLHRDDATRPVAEIIEVLNEQVQRGTIRYFGCSNWTVPRIAEAQQYAQQHGLLGFIGNQVMWSLAKPNVANISDKTMVLMDDEGLAYHQQTGMPVIAYSSQANGFFSGKYQRDTIPGNQSVRNHYYNEENFARLDRVAEVAKSLGKTQTEIALGYLISQPFPVFPIIGSRTLAQLSESCLAGDLRLAPEILNYLATGTGASAG